MSYGACANKAEVIEQDWVKATCPDELQDFIDFIVEYCDLATFAQEKMYHLSPIDESFGDQNDQLEFDISFAEKAKELHKQMCEKWNKLYIAFEQKTGLQLDVGYHYGSDEGSRYDKVNELFWHVHGVFQLTDAGKKNTGKWETKSWVVHG
jgi:hypothetical protein